MGWSNQVIIANQVIIEGTNDGVFVYSGPPGLGNPPIAWITANASDPYGNPLPGAPQIIGVGTPLGRSVTLLTDGSMAFQSTGDVGAGSLGVNGSGRLDLSTAIVNLGDSPAILDMKSVVTTGGTLPSFSFNGTIIAGQINAATTVTNPSTISTDSPHAVTGFLNGWTAGPELEYQLYPDQTVGLWGSVIPGTIANNTNMFQLPLGYRPVTLKYWEVRTEGGAALANTPSLQITGSGVVQCFNLPAGTTAVRFTARFSTLT